MDSTYLINAADFYLRQNWRLKRAGLNPSNDVVEAAMWEYAQRAADRLERLRDHMARELIPVPVKRRRGEFPNAP